jgi:peptidoglycan L-alanyl-D-glutamate endopeptidase CwlK
MPTALFSRINLDTLYPPFLQVALEVVERCRQKGALYVATFGYRSANQQAQMHADWIARKPGAGRAAPAFSSAHQYGLALDFVRDGDEAPGVQPRWDAPAYETLGEEAQRAGLLWGGSFGDRPHMQWPDYLTGRSMAPLRNLYLRASSARSLADCWEYLDAERAQPDWARRNPLLAAELQRLELATHAA